MTGMTGSLQTAMESDIRVPEFDQDEKGTIPLQLGTPIGCSFLPHFLSFIGLIVFLAAHRSGEVPHIFQQVIFFSCDFPARPANVYLSRSQRPKPETIGHTTVHPWLWEGYHRAVILMRWQQYTML